MQQERDVVFVATTDDEGTLVAQTVSTEFTQPIEGFLRFVDEQETGSGTHPDGLHFVARADIVQRSTKPPGICCVQRHGPSWPTCSAAQMRSRG